MSTGQWLGGVLGGILGYLLAPITFGVSAIVGGIYGAIIGYTIGGIIDPVKPDVRQPGAPTQALQVMSNQIGNPIFDVLGTAKISGQLLFFGKEFNRGKYIRVEHQTQLVGHRYFASWAVGICMGQADVLYTVFRDQDSIWEGEVGRPESGGEVTIQIEGMGTMVFYFGTGDQVPNANAGSLLTDSTLNTGYRHFCWAFFDACFMNEYNRMPSMSFVIKKIPPMFDEPTSQIQTYDINPAHALWHTLIEKAGLPEEWVDSVDFLAVATELFGEGRGISILFDTHQATLNYLEAINSHVDMILRYGSDGKFHPKLIRYDYTQANLPIINESKLLEEPTFSRRSWIDTINEVKVQYSEILRRGIGGVYIVGSIEPTGTGGAWGLEKRTVSSGKLLYSFVIDIIPGQMDVARSVKVRENDLFIGGYSIQGTTPHWYLQRRDSGDGSLIWGFTLGPFDGSVMGMDLDEGAGRIVAVGYKNVVDGKIQLRNMSDGNLVWEVADNLLGSHLNCVAYYGEYIYVGGYRIISQFNWDFLIQKRDAATGSLVWELIIPGLPPGVYYSYDEITAIKADGTGLYTAGRLAQGALGCDWIMEKRSLEDGSVIWSEIQNFSPADDNLFSMDIDANFMYLGGSSGAGGVWHWAIQKRNKGGGSLVWEIIEEDPNPQGQIYGLCLGSDYFCVVGEAGGTDRWRSQVRQKSNGGLKWQKESNNYPYCYDIAYSVDV